MGKCPCAKLDDTALDIWLWISVVAAVAGAIMLYPIDGVAANVCFIIIKIGMVCGLLLMLLATRKSGYWIWVGFSGAAIVMTAIKWSIAGAVSPLFVLAICTDIVMPLVAFLIWRSHRNRHAS